MYAPNALMPARKRAPKRSKIRYGHEAIFSELPQQFVRPLERKRQRVGACTQQVDLDEVC
jgi:hypothetical protein